MKGQRVGVVLPVVDAEGGVDAADRLVFKEKIQLGVVGRGPPREDFAAEDLDFAYAAK